MEAHEEFQVGSVANASPTLGVHLRGDPDKISAEALEAVARSLHDLLKASSKALLPDDGEPVWVVARLALNSISAGFKPRTDWADTGNRVIGEVAEGLEAFKNAGEVPDSWDYDMLSALRRVTKLDRISGAEGVDFWIGDTGHKLSVDEEFSRIVERALSQEQPLSRGSVTGHVVGWKDDFGTEMLTIQDESSRNRVQVRLTSDSGLTIQEVAGSRLRVWGDLKRNKQGKKILLIMHDFETLPDREIVSIELIKGLWTDDERRVDSVDFQRRLRDEE
ncbi:hypothetical protein [Glutamicibacter sp. NPDC127525]|uniref:hypothetical protein n=1 Tax=unclassified Glutamicibacter TaxID=2627139 RepID=UPI003631EF3F